MRLRHELSALATAYALHDVSKLSRVFWLFVLLCSLAVFGLAVLS
jgi:hypothetical protein